MFFSCRKFGGSPVFPPSLFLEGPAEVPLVYSVYTSKMPVQAAAPCVHCVCTRGGAGAQRGLTKPYRVLKLKVNLWHCCGGPPSAERRSPAAAHSKFQSSNVLKHVQHRETAKRPCIRMKRLREAVQRNFTRVPQQEGEAACTSHHSLQTQVFAV